MKRILSPLMVCLFVACNNSSETNVQTLNDTLKTVKSNEAVPTAPPLKVTGSFAGELPCIDCKKLGVLLTLTENTYERAQHKEAPKVKSDLLKSSRGTCKQDSGLITLFDTEGKAIEWYKIISIDSLELVPKSAKSTKTYPLSFLVRKDGQKLVK